MTIIRWLYVGAALGLLIMGAGVVWDHKCQTGEMVLQDRSRLTRNGGHPMEVSTATKAHLTYEDICKAIAEYASKYRAGDFTFDPETVTISPENEGETIEVEATVSTISRG